MEKDNFNDQVSLLIEKTGCNQEQAESILRSTNRDLEQAISIITSLSSKNTFIIKGRFACKTEKLYGLFLIQADNIGQEIKKLDLIVSRNALLCQWDIGCNWDELEKYIHSASLRKSELSNKKMAKLHHDLIDLFNNVNSEEKKNIFKSLASSEISELKGILSIQIGRLLDDPNIDLVLDVNQLTVLERDYLEKKATKEKIPSEEETLNKTEVASLAPEISLQIALILSPVSGILVTELKPGDCLTVRIIDTTTIGQYLAGLMGARDKDKIISTVANIEDLTPVGFDKIKVQVRFGPGIIGTTVVSKNVKIKSSLGGFPDKKKNLLSKLTPTSIKEKIITPLPLRPVDLAILIMIVLLIVAIMVKL
ncbi:MAG: hypothetical protein ABIG09_00500 [bacterium]